MIFAPKKGGWVIFSKKIHFPQECTKLRFKCLCRGRGRGPMPQMGMCSWDKMIGLQRVRQTTQPFEAWYSNRAIYGPALIQKPLREERIVYTLRNALFDEQAKVADFWPVLAGIPCLGARLPCLLHQKLKKIKNTQNVVQVVANATWTQKNCLNCVHIRIVIRLPGSHSHVIPIRATIARICPMFFMFSPFPACVPLCSSDFSCNGPLAPW